MRRHAAAGLIHGPRGLLIPALAIGSLIACAAADTHAQVIRNFTRRNPATNARGNITITGNVLVTCQAKNNNNCATARSGGATANNSDYNTVYVDADADGATANSSSATLTLPSGSSVLWAGLYWGARSTAAARSQIKFKPAGSGLYSTLTASQLDSTTAASNAYQGFADVTSQVQSGGAGTYWVAGAAADNGNDGTGFYAGWSLVVVYQDNTQPLRNLTVFDGFASVSNGNNVTTSVSGFLTPTSGTYNAFVGAVAYEGDQGITGDGMRINSTQISDALNPADNFFNSSVTRTGTRISAKNPDYVNQLGFDVDTVSVASANAVLGNGATGASLSFTSTQDLYYPGVLTFAVDVYQPQVDGNVTKTARDVNGGALNPGDQLEYTITVTNTGSDAAAGMVLRDTVPANTTYVAGSLRVGSGDNAGPKSDAAGDDQAEFDGTRVVFRLGSGASAAAGGSLAPGASTTAVFLVQINASTANNTVVSNQAALDYTAATLGIASQTSSDGDTSTPGNQPTDVTVTIAPVPHVTLCKTFPGVPCDPNNPPAPLTNQLPDADITYVINFTSDGNTFARSLSITDQVPAGMYFKVGSMSAALGSTGLSVAYFYSFDGGLNFTNATQPVSGGGGAPAGYDATVTHVRWVFTGNLSQNPPNNAGSVSFVARIR
jgi:uncharacterized repeat protein (TIGR01451 family)